MRTSSLVLLALAWWTAPVVGQVQTKQQLLLELSLPPLALPPLGKVKHLLPNLKGTDLKVYADKGPQKSPIRKAVRAAQVALWAISPEPAPVPLQAEVNAVRKKLKLDPHRLRMRYTIPVDAETEKKTKGDLHNDVKQLSRLIAHLEDVLADLKEVENSRGKEGPRWQAHYDLLKVWVLLRLVALEEQQTTLGALRRDYPDYDLNKHRAFQMIPDERLRDFTSRRYFKQATKWRDQIAKDRKGTAWDKLAAGAIEVHLSNRWATVP